MGLFIVYLIWVDIIFNMVLETSITYNLPEESTGKLVRGGLGSKHK